MGVTYYIKRKFQTSACTFLLSILTMIPTLTVGYYHQPSFLAPVYDQYGYEITGDRVLEITALKSTSLGFGLGWNYSAPAYRSLGPPIIPPYIVTGNVPPAPRPNGLYPNVGFSAGQNSNAPRAPQSPARSYKPTERQPQLPREYTPFNHRRFKRQAGFPADGTPDGLLGQFNPSSLDINFGPSDFRPSGSSFLGPFNDQSGPFFEPSLPTQGPLPDTRFSACQPQQTIQCNRDSRFRTVDGVCNNLANPKWGAAMQPFLRLHSTRHYFDGLDAPRMTSVSDPRRLLPSPRLVSRLIHEPDRPGHGIPELSSLIHLWGQFIDHDITGTPAHKDADGKDLKCCDNVYLSEERQIHNDVFNGGPCNPIYIPPLDRHFRYSCMNFARSQAAPRRSDCDPGAPQEPREQMNILTAFLDASQVYGSSLKDNNNIRLFRLGMLRVTEFDLLPEDVNSTCVKDSPSDYCFKAGETRVNEHPALASLHTIFHRLHNTMAQDMVRVNPRWTDEHVFQEVRKIIGAFIQHMTYSDWLPIVLGSDTMNQYSLSVSDSANGQFRFGNFWSYDSNANPTVLNEFAAAAFRFGHTLIPSTSTVGNEKIRLHRMFNRPSFVLRDNGASIAKFCSGLIQDSVQHFDRFISTDLSDRLFEDMNNISMDLAALNIQRGRDHGLPGYNEYREICGLQRIRSFDELYKEDPDRAEVFRRVYDHVDDIDLFTAGVSERPLAGALVGHTFACILGKQFRALKFGDRYWYENANEPVAFTSEQLKEIKSFSLSKVLCMMAPLSKVTVNPFYTDGAFLPRPVTLSNGEVVTQNRYVDCSLILNVGLSRWADTTPQTGKK